MRSQTLATLVGLMILPLTSHGFVPMSFLKEAGDKAIARASKNTKAKRAEGCKDFSGKWKGQCTRNGEVKEETSDIVQQGCYSIKMTGPDSTVNYLFGEMQTDAKASLFVNTSYSQSVSWNKAQDVVQIAGVVHFVSPFLDGPVTGSLAGQMMYDGEQLVSYAKIVLPMEETEVNCRFSRVP